MRVRSVLFSILFSSILALPFTNTQSQTAGQPVSGIQQQQYIMHTVQAGETAYSIANGYSTSVEQIYRMNPGTENGIKTGSQLRIPVNANSQQNQSLYQNNTPQRKIVGYRDHQIETKQTLFGLAQMYGVSTSEIMQANPGLTESTFQIGRTIKIPIFNNEAQQTSVNIKTGMIQHKASKGETIYSISKLYNVSLEDLFMYNPQLVNGLKKDMVLQIPQSASPQKEEQPIVYAPPVPSYSGNTINQPLQPAVNTQAAKIAILLPFNDNKGSIQKEKLTEYYEGFLLAVREMKVAGMNADIYTFDTGPENDPSRLKNILETAELASCNVIIGGVSPIQIDILSKFAQAKGVNYVIPFDTKGKIAYQNANVFQLNNSHSALYPQITRAFAGLYTGYNIVFVSESGSKGDKADFTATLKNTLKSSGIPYKSIVIEANKPDDINAMLDASRKNVIVGESSSENTLRKLINIAQNKPDFSLELFGYPEWQTYSSIYNDLYKYNTRIYSIFFLDQNQWKVQAVEKHYKDWYNKSIINSFPKYAYLGYDNGLFFLTAASKFGSNLGQNISTVSVPTLQSAMHFEQDPSIGGYINTGVYIIQFKSDSTIQKTEFDR